MKVFRYHHKRSVFTSEQVFLRCDVMSLNLNLCHLVLLYQFYVRLVTVYNTGEPQTFTLSVKPARNYPLDMYFLMDLSASQSPDLVTLRNLSQSIS